MPSNNSYKEFTYNEQWRLFSHAETGDIWNEYVDAQNNAMCGRVTEPYVAIYQ